MERVVRIPELAFREDDVAMASVATTSFSKRAFAAGFLALATGLGGIGKSLKGAKNGTKEVEVSEG
jgi:hypothetical protein